MVTTAEIHNLVVPRAGVMIRNPSGDYWGTNVMVSTWTSSHWLKLSTCPSCQFLAHPSVHSSNPYFSNLEVRVLWGATIITELQRDAIFSVPLLLLMHTPAQKVTWTGDQRDLKCIYIFDNTLPVVKNCCVILGYYHEA